MAVQGAFRFKRLKRLFRTKSSSRSVRFKIRRGNSNAAFTRQTQYWCFENARKNFSFGQGLACFNWIRIQLLFPLVPFYQHWSERNRFSRGTPLINTVGHCGPFVASQHHFLVQETLVVPENLPPGMSNSANAQTGCLAKNNKPKSPPSTGKMRFGAFLCICMANLRRTWPSECKACFMQ